MLFIFFLEGGGEGGQKANDGNSASDRTLMSLKDAMHKFLRFFSLNSAPQGERHVQEGRNRGKAVLSTLLRTALCGKRYEWPKGCQDTGGLREPTHLSSLFSCMCVCVLPFVLLKKMWSGKRAKPSLSLCFSLSSPLLGLLLFLSPNQK